jgi:hypothetical protein
VSVKVLSREAILGADDLAPTRVRVSEWGGVVLVRQLTAADRDAFEVSILSEQGAVNLRARLVALVAVDEDGARLFAAEDVEALGAKSARAVDRVFSVAQKINGLGQAELEDLAGN